MVARELIPAAAYLRRSTDRQEQSLADQRAAIHEWASRHGYRIAFEFVDDAISGTSAKGRSGFQSMIAAAEQRRFQAVIVWNSDRFSRGDVTETEHYRYVLRQSEVTLLSVTEDFLAREGLEGDVLRTIRQAQNRQYSVSLSQNTLRGQVSAVLGASDPGRMTPYGYDREVLNPDGAVAYRVRFLEGGDRELRDREGRLQSTYGPRQTLRKPGKDCRARLVLSDPRRVRTVREIFHMCCDGAGFKAIAAELNRQGVLSPRGGLWQHTTIKALVANPVYRGDIVWNRRSQAKFFKVSQGRVDRMRPNAQSGRVESLPEDDWIVLKDEVPAIVDRATWEKAQAASAVRAEANNGRGKQSTRWLLSGVMRCAACGHPYWGLVKRKGKKPGRTDVAKAYYICSGRCTMGASICPVSTHVPAEDIEDWVLLEVGQAVLADGATLEAAIDRFVNRAMEGRGEGLDTAATEAELRQVEATVTTLLRGIDAANLPLVNDKLTALRRRKEALESQLRTARERSGGLDDKALRKFARERIEALREAMRGTRDDSARQVIASYVREIIIDPATRTGTMVLAEELEPAGAPASSAAPQVAATPHATACPSNANDRPRNRGRSQVSGIAGVGFEPTTSGL